MHGYENAQKLVEIAIEQLKLSIKVVTRLEFTEIKRGTHLADNFLKIK